MKILQVNCVYNNGSTGKITYDIHTGLQNSGIDSVVCYGRGKKTDEKNVHKVCGELYSHANHLISRVTGIMYGGCFFSTNKLISVIKREKPDIVHLHCINGYFVNIYKLLEWLKNNNVLTVMTLHAEFMYTGGCSHATPCNKWIESTGCGDCTEWRKKIDSVLFDRTADMWKRMKKAYDGFGKRLLVVSVSPWLMDRAKMSPMLKDYEHRVVMNGLDTDVFHPYSQDSSEEIKKELGIGKEKVIFHATPRFSDDEDHIKGGYYVLKLAQMMPDVKFVVAGNADDNINAPGNVILLGKITDQTRLAELYSMADMTLLTSRKETFSMVTAETLCCGTPVVGFKAGAPEIIALEDYSEFVEHGNIDMLYSAVKRMLERNTDGTQIAEQAKVYSKETMTKNYMEIYRELLDNNR